MSFRNPLDIKRIEKLERENAELKSAMPVATEPAHTSCVGCKNKRHKKLFDEETLSVCVQCYGWMNPNGARKNYTPAPAPAPKWKDDTGQAEAWEAVFELCMSLGMKLGDTINGEQDVCAFIRTLAQRAGEMETKFGYTYCAYCGQTFARDAPDVTDKVSEHICTCSKHPMRTVEKERDEWKQRAGEERYSECDFLSWLMNQRYKSCTSSDMREHNCTIERLLDRLNDPQVGIAAVTKRKGG